MASLTAHFLEGGDHGRLGFHASCPVCREQRLFGALSPEPVISRRAQAALASGVLALSSGAPAASAYEPDTRQEGIAAPEQPVAGEVGAPDADAPEFDPGGETALPFEVAPVPTSPHTLGQEDSGEGAPLDSEPSDDPDGRLAAPDGPVTPETGSDDPVPPAEAFPQGDHPAESDPNLDALPPAADGDPLAPDAELQAPEGQSEVGERGRAPERGGSAPDRRLHPQPIDAPPIDPRADSTTPSAPGLEPALAPAPAPAAATPLAPTGVEQSAPASAREALPGSARFHVVQPGDSLWSIAKRLLGRDASPARIAREVDRLWSLNGDRIGTGDPDLLMIGTKLRLR